MTTITKYEIWIGFMVFMLQTKSFYSILLKFKDTFFFSCTSPNKIWSISVHILCVPFNIYIDAVGYHIGDLAMDKHLLYFIMFHRIGI